jgi:hypothetical protein
MHRIKAAIVLAIVMAVVAALVATPTKAIAAQPIIAFEGSSLLGLPLLACASQPKLATLSITAGSPVEVANQTGHPAEMYINGQAKKHLDAGATTSVALTAGIWSVTVVPDCLLNVSAAGVAVITVAPQRSPSPPPTPAPTVTPTPTSAAPTLVPGASHSPGSSPTNKPGSTAPPRIPQPPGHTAKTPDPTLAGDTSGQTPNYLLILIAAIGIIGVATAAVRAVRLHRDRHVGPRP